MRCCKRRRTSMKIVSKLLTLRDAPVQEPAPAPPRTKKKAHGPPRVARMLGRPQQAPVSTQGRLPPTSTRKARGPPRVAMLAQQSREQRALDADSGQTLPRHNVRLKKSKGPAALFRENVVGASHKGPKKPTTAWGSPESKGTSSEEREALEAAAQALELNEDNLEDKPDFMEASEDDFADERQIMMEKTHERSSAEKIMDALQSDFMAGRKEGTASEGGRVVAGAPNVVADADSNNANVGGDDADENLLVPHDEAKMAYERVLVVKRGPAGKLGMHLADWEQGGTGVIVDSVAQSGPADRCGVKANDVLISIDDKPVLDKNKGEVAEIIHNCGERFAVVVSQEVKLLAMRIAEEAKAAKDNVAAEVAREMSLLQAKVSHFLDRSRCGTKYSPNLIVVTSSMRNKRSARENRRCEMQSRSASGLNLRPLWKKSDNVFKRKNKDFKKSTLPVLQLKMPFWKQNLGGTACSSRKRQPKPNSPEQRRSTN